MTTKTAMETLIYFKGYKLVDVYDNHPELEDAIQDLCAQCCCQFEYPDWSYRSVNALIVWFEEHI